MLNLAERFIYGAEERIGMGKQPDDESTGAEVEGVTSWPVWSERGLLEWFECPSC